MKNFVQEPKSSFLFIFKKYRRLWVSNRRKRLLKSHALVFVFPKQKPFWSCYIYLLKNRKTILTCQHRLEGTNRALWNFFGVTLNHKYSIWLSIIFRSFRQIRRESHKNLPCPHTVSVTITEKNCISRGRIQIPVVSIKSPMIEITIKDTLNPFTPKI